MPFGLKSGAVSVVVPSGSRLLNLKATMFGYPVCVSGKPALVEVSMPGGRSTLARFSDVTPLDDAARALLAGRPAEKNV